jgi:hypothetical protein
VSSEQELAAGAGHATRENLSAMSSWLDLLMRLSDARTAGMLTDDEFTQEQNHLLAPPVPHP